MNKKKTTNLNNQSLSIYEVVTYHYAELMAIAKREYYKLYSEKYKDNEDSYKDTAHDTIVKMCDMFDKVKLSLVYAKSYFCKAVRLNYLRDFIRPQNKKYVSLNADKEDFGYMAAEPNMEAPMDFEIITGEIRSKFGDRDCDLFLKFMEGDTYRELDKHYNIHNSAYIVRRIRNFIESNYYGYEVKRKPRKHHSQLLPEE